jgi:hypothetical protein
VAQKDGCIYLYDDSMQQYDKQPPKCLQEVTGLYHLQPVETWSGAETNARCHGQAAAGHYEMVLR